MTRICGILTIAAGLALSGCASDNVAWQDNNSTHSDKQPAGVASGDNNYERSRQDASISSNTSDTMDNTTGSNANNNNAGPQLGNGSDKTSMTTGISNQDSRFINDALAGGMYEVNAGDRALLKSSDPAVKNLALHLVDDHTKANQQLKALANRKGLRVVDGMTDEQNKMLAQLDKLQGSDFDKEYLSQQQTAHQQAVQEFQDIAKNANDKDLRAERAAATLPTLRDHLQMVQNQATGVNPNSGIGSDK